MRKNLKATLHLITICLSLRCLTVSPSLGVPGLTAATVTDGAYLTSILTLAGVVSPALLCARHVNVVLCIARVGVNRTEDAASNSLEEDMRRVW